jgi:hypothetical protein
MKYVIGKFSDLSVQGNQLVGTTTIPNTSFGNDALELYDTGVINQHSIGFMSMRAEVSQNADTPRVIKEVKLYEGSAVLWGANPNTPTLNVNKSEIEIALEIEEEMDFYRKGLKNGKLSDDMLALFEIRLLQTKDKLLLTTTHTTQAEAPASPAPVRKGKAFAKQLLIASLNF